MADELWMHAWSYNEPDHWAEQAKCRGLAYELFEYQEKDSPLAKGMSYRERRDFNATNFEQAAEICIECPVFFECKAAATEDDRMWTVRGGEPPERFERERVSINDERLCKKGHLISSGERCKQCKREYVAARRAALKGV